jgi:hypothetical protein
MYLNDVVAGGILSDVDKEALRGEPGWEGSRFGQLESFILEFLVGGASVGESVRLKLQTPLYVADALLEASSQQLAEDLAAAEQVRTFNLLSTRPVPSLCIALLCMPLLGRLCCEASTFTLESSLEGSELLHIS